MLTNNVRIGRQNRSKLRKVMAKLKIEAEDEDEQLAAKPDYDLNNESEQEEYEFEPPEQAEYNTRGFRTRGGKGPPQA